MLKSSDSRQLNFVFADNSPSSESKDTKKADVSAGKAHLLRIAEDSLTIEADALVDDHDASRDRLLEQVASLPNLARALLFVARNKGAAGVDGVSTDEVVEASPDLLPKLQKALILGSYQPGDIRRVWIPKPGGGERGLGIPNVVDRLVQQAVRLQVEPIFEPTFHASSHGFRPYRGAPTAIAEAASYFEDGYGITVDVDLSKFFDRVHHQRLLARLGRLVEDGRVLKLISEMLKAKVVLPDGTRVVTTEGTPQGGPLSPLLSNIVLDELDWELDRRGLRFVRYADDFSIFVRSERSGHRVMASVQRFIEGKLRLVINEEKSSVSNSYDLNFLGFWLGKNSRGKVTVAISRRTSRRLDARVRELTPRNWGGSFESCVSEINVYLIGRSGYFRLCTTASRFETVDAHIRRRLRALLVRQKKRPRHLYRFLLRHGVSERAACKSAFGIHGHWQRSKSYAVHQVYSNPWFASRLVSLRDRWQEYRNSLRASEQLELF